MTLTVHPELVQGSEDWHAQRRGIVTASVVGRLITAKTLKPASNPESRSLTALLASERITGWTESTYMNDDMWRGVVDEPRARDKYAEHCDVEVTEVGFMTEDRWGFTIGYSPDGLVGDDGLIEIKSRRPKKQVETIVSGHPPIENMAQCQAGLLVTGRKWLDYVSYCGGMPMWIHRIYPDQKWFDAIVAAVELFEQNAAELNRIYQESAAGFPLTERIIGQDMVI